MSADWETAKRRHDLSGFAYELASTDYQDEYWRGCSGGGDQEGFKLSYEIMLTDYGLPHDRRNVAVHFGLDDEQHRLLMALAQKIVALQKTIGLPQDNSVCTANPGWPDLVASAQALFVALNVSRS